MKLELHHHSNDFKKFNNDTIVGTVDDQNVKWFFKGLVTTNYGYIFERLKFLLYSGQNVWAFQDQALKPGYPKKFIISKGVFITFFTGKLFEKHLNSNMKSFLICYDDL